MSTRVDFWFDAVCPWAWMTSRWILEAQKVRDIEVTFHPMSLAVLNEGGDHSEEFQKVLAAAWIPARAAILVEQRHGPEKVEAFYTALGTRFHPGDEPNTVETIAAALGEIGADKDIIDIAQTDAVDDALRESHRRGVEPVGGDVGTPVIHINGKALFGPVISPAPKGEAAGELFDGFVKVTAYDGFYELKRSRGPEVRPVFA